MEVSWAGRNSHSWKFYPTEENNEQGKEHEDGSLKASNYQNSYCMTLRSAVNMVDTASSFLSIYIEYDFKQILGQVLTLEERYSEPSFS